MGYVPREDSNHAEYVIAAFGQEYTAQRQAKCPYDPRRERILS